ncbi:PilW family protein [bacterium]|nr:PilW family protein [bacterium]
MKMLYHDCKGYTLTEIIIALMIGLILMSAATATYIAQNRSFVTQESVSEINTQAKIAHDLIANEIKAAGFAAPSDLNVDPVNGLAVISTPVDSTNGPDALTIVGGFRMIGTLWPAGLGPGIACPANIDMGSTQARVILSGTDAANTTDKRFINIDGVNYVEIQNCSADADGNCDSSTLTIDRGLSQAFPLQDTTGDGLCDTGRPVYLVEDTTYCVDNNLILRRLRRNVNAATCTAVAASDNDAIAENIEDLQFAYAVDANNDDQIDDQNGDNVITGADFINGAAVVNNASIRAVRINILARSDRPDPNFAGLGLPPAAIENRNHNQVADSLRRRWWQTMAHMRNQ